MIYLDNAATTIIAPEVFGEMSPYFLENYGNPSSVYQLGRSSKSAIEKSRLILCKFLKCNTNELYFVSCATEAHNIIFSQFDQLGVKTIITSKIEHAAVLKPIERLSNKLNIVYLKNNSKGELDYDHLEKILATNPNSLVSLMHVNNELGNINNIKEISIVCKKYKAYFHCDTVQSIGHGLLNLSEVDIDFAVGSAHKFHGPKGVGFLYIKKGIPVQPLLVGGKQENEFRAGTENVPGIVGLGSAIEQLSSNLDTYESHMKNLKQFFIKKVKETFPFVHINGSNNTVSHIVNLGINSPKLNKMFLFALDMKGFAVSGGSACSSGAVKSHVAEALGIPDTEGYVRVSFSRYTTQDELEKFIDCLKEML